MYHLPQCEATMNDLQPDDSIFDLPQRQSPMGILVEAGFAVYKVVKAFWVLLLYFVLKPIDVPIFYMWSGGVVVLVLIGVVGYLAFRSFYFHIDRQRGEFVLQRGVLSKKRTVFQMGRIQQVNINQGLLQKLANVYGVEIETAGSSRSEARIRAVSYEVAQMLRFRLLETSLEQKLDDEQVAAEVTEEDRQPFIKISLGSLFKMGITSKYVESFFILLAFFFGVLNNIRDVFMFNGEGETRFNAFLESFALLNVIGVVVIVLILLTVLFNLGRTFVTYFRLSIQKTNRGLSISYGLINSRNILLYPQKVQMMVLTSNYFQRKIGLRWMTIRQASAIEQRNVNAHIQIPGSSILESESVMRFIFDRVPDRGVLFVPNYRKWLMDGLLFLGLPILAYIVLVVVSGFQWIGFLGLLLYGVLATLLIRVNYRRGRLYVNDDFIIQQYGIWDVRTIIIEPHKIQSIQTTQFFWQKKSNVGHLSIQTASGKVVFRFAEYDRVQIYINRWLYQVESSARPWM